MRSRLRTNEKQGHRVKGQSELEVFPYPYFRCMTDHPSISSIVTLESFLMIPILHAWIYKNESFGEQRYCSHIIHSTQQIGHNNNNNNSQTIFNAP